MHSRKTLKDKVELFTTWLFSGQQELHMPKSQKQEAFKLLSVSDACFKRLRTYAFIKYVQVRKTQAINKSKQTKKKNHQFDRKICKQENAAHAAQMMTDGCFKGEAKGGGCAEHH